MCQEGLVVGYYLQRNLQETPAIFHDGAHHREANYQKEDGPKREGE